MMINKERQSSSLFMALAIIAATMLVSTVVVETLDLFGDAEAKEIKKRKKCNPAHTCHSSGGD